jgi:stage II sporulation protein M
MQLNLPEEFMECGEYECREYREYGTYIVAITLIFATSLIAGYGYAALNPSESARFVEELSAELGWIMDLSPLEIFLVIFLNNAIKALLVIILGLLIVVPAGFVAYNGWVLGIVICEEARTSGYLSVAAGILPHGIIELPMIILSAALGTRLGMMAFLRMKGTISNKDILSEIKRSVNFYLRWILPLLFIAAMIETFITPVVLHLIRG